MVRPLHPTKELEAAVADVLGDRIVRWTPVPGGFSAAGLWVMETRAGRSLFVKAATADATARFLRDEMVVYRNVEADFLPDVEAWVDDGHRPFLVLEDLSNNYWPPPWTTDGIRSV